MKIVFLMDDYLRKEMKKLIVIRHAKSSWDDHTLADFDRPLNKRGERDAPRMGKRLKEKRIIPDALLTIPATRAITTCKKIAETLGCPLTALKTDERLYHAGEETILKVVQELNDKHDLVLLFGHNPGLTDFVNRLLNENIDNIPTCGVVSCLLPTDKWKQIIWGTGKMEFFDYPKSKD